MTIEWSELPENYWHCYVKFVGSKVHHADGILNDLTLDQIRRQVVEPWLQGRPFSVGGAIVKSASEVSKIGVVQTDQVQRHYADNWETEMKAKNIVDMTRRDTCRRTVGAG